jgi:hypothetical protein
VRSWEAGVARLAQGLGDRRLGLLGAAGTRVGARAGERAHERAGSSAWAAPGRVEREQREERGAAREREIRGERE